MKRLLFILILVPSIVFANDQKPWFIGHIVFHTGDTLVCKLRFTRKVSEGLIQVLREDRIEILTVKNVQSFSYFDANRNATRTFYNLALIPELSTRKHEIFIELLHATDRFSILNHKSMGYSDKGIQINPFRKKVVVNKMYIFDKVKSEIVPLNKENILALMEENKNAVLGYIESKSLKLKNVEDYIALIEYHQKGF